jgi:3-oxoadipate enol-lactonase
MDMRSLSVDLVGPEPKIAVKRAGEGPLLLLFHGIGGSKENWDNQLDVFSTSFKAGAWDARGYGDSQDYPGPCDFDDFARDVLKVVDFYGRRKAHLMGLSMGGRIAQRFYFMFPDRVASLTLCDTQMTFQQRSEADREAFLAARQAPLLAGKTPRDIAPAVVKSLVGPNATSEAIQICIDSMNRLRTETYLKTLAATVRQPIAGELADIKVPTHIIVGEFDQLTPPAISAEMAKRIRGSKLTIIPDAGHLSNMEAPAAFNSAAQSFLADVRRLADG